MKEKKEIMKINHPLKTRRDFLSQGLVSMGAFSLAPSLFSLLQSGQAHGATGSCTSLNSAVFKTPIILLDLAGGGNIAGSNVMVGGASGQHDYLASYDRLGLPLSYHPSGSGMVNEEFGLKFHSMSAMLAGMKAVTSASTRANCEGIVFCATSADDTGNNPHSPIYWLGRAGAKGDLISSAGTESGRSGANSTIPAGSFDPTLSPVPITRPEDVVELVSLGRISTVFSKSQSLSILKTIERMSEAKLKAFSDKSLPEQVKEVVRCGYSKSAIDQRVNSTDSRFSSTNLDPRNDTVLTSVYTKLNDNTSAEQGNQRREAAIAKLVIDGYSGVGSITMGGFDYHNNPRSQTDAKDFEAGQAIGRILELAAKKKKNVAIYVYTDGAVSSQTTASTTDTAAQGKFEFVGDDGEKSSSFMIVYKAGGRPVLRHLGSNSSLHQRQLGNFKPDQNVQKGTNLLSNNVTNLSKTVVLNYLALHGEEDSIESIVGDNPFDKELDNYVMFKSLK